MKKFRKILSVVITIALVASINWGYFTQLLTLTKDAAIECVTGGSSAGAALTAQLQDISVSKFFDFSVDDYLTGIWDHFAHGDDSDEEIGVASSIPTQQQMHEAVTQWARMEESLADSNRKLDKFNTATVVYDAGTGNYYYGMNRGIQLSSDSLNSSLVSWLPDTTLDKRYRVGNCAEVDAVNQALNSGANVTDLYMYTIDTKDNTPKPMCNNCIYTFVGRMADIFSE